MYLILTCVIITFLISSYNAALERLSDVESPLSNFITGPHYLNPIPFSITTGTGGPAAAKGSCEQGTVFTIHTVDDLVKQINDLECIYHAGIAPSTIPLGPQYGTVLKFGTSDLLTPLLATLWKGKIFSFLRCPNDFFLGLNDLLGRVRVAALLSIGVPYIKLAPGEFNDNRPTLIIDYTQSFADKCTTAPDSLWNEKDLSFDVLDNIYPFRLVVDVVRIVGRQSDGGAIYLGKTYVQDPFRLDRQAYNVAFWAVVNYDPLVTNLTPGEALPPLLESFTFMEPDAWQGFFRLMPPFDNLLVDTSGTLERFFTYYDDIAKLINRRSGLDVRRGIKRGHQSLSHIVEFYISLISSLLSQNHLLLSGLTYQHIVESLFVQVQEEKIEKPTALGAENIEPQAEALPRVFLIPILKNIVEIFKSPRTASIYDHVTTIEMKKTEGFNERRKEKKIEEAKNGLTKLSEASNVARKINRILNKSTKITEV